MPPRCVVLSTPIWSNTGRVVQAERDDACVRGKTTVPADAKIMANRVRRDAAFDRAIADDPAIVLKTSRGGGRLPTLQTTSSPRAHLRVDDAGSAGIQCQLAMHRERPPPRRAG
jgi:hypothetical protein